MTMATSVCGQELIQDENDTTQRKKHQLQGGFECIFVNDPPEHLQTECSVCLCILREPYLVDCCGNSFCKTCIETVKSENKPCPLCNVQFTTCIPDKRLQRTLNDFQIFCSHKGDGCKWAGSLGILSQHLNAQPQSEVERLRGCKLTSIECKHCSDSIRRWNIVDHETHGCPKRPHSCEHCHNFASTFENVSLHHYPVCPDRPVPCSNGCGLLLKLELLEDHMKRECPLEVVECPFNFAGCTEKTSRRSMAEHITQNLALHMSLQAASHQREQRKLNSRISELEAQLSKAVKAYECGRAKVDELEKANKLLLDTIQQECKNQVAIVGQDLKVVQEQRLKGHLATMKGELKKVQAETKQEITKQHQATLKGEIRKAQAETKQEITKEYQATLRGEIKKIHSETKQEMAKQVKYHLEDVHNHISLVPFTVTMPTFGLKKLLNISWYSPSFYTHPRGYKMCLRVDANGSDDGMNSHVSVFVYMINGEYDDHLEWPFQGDITIQILNQVGGEEHSTRIFDVTADDDNFGSRVLDRERVLGISQFIPHQRLTPNYLKDNCLQLRVQEVNITMSCT